MCPTSEEQQQILAQEEALLAASFPSAGTSAGQPQPSTQVGQEQPQQTTQTQPEQPSEILSVAPTTNPDSFIVRVQQPDGSYKQVLMTRQEVLDAGGEIPVNNMTWGQGAGAAWSNPNAITEQDITQAYKDLGLEPPDFSNAPRTVTNYYDGSDYTGNQDIKANMAGLAGYYDESGGALYAHPSQFGSIGAALNYLNNIKDENARNDYKKAFQGYFGIESDKVVRDLPGLQQQIQSELGILDDKAFNDTVQRYKDNPNSDEFKTVEEGGNLTIEQVALLAKAAGVPFDAEQKFLDTHIKLDLPDFGIRPGYRFDEETGKYYRLENDGWRIEDSKRVEVTKDEATYHGTEYISKKDYEELKQWVEDSGYSWDALEDSLRRGGMAMVQGQINQYLRYKAAEQEKLAGKFDDYKISDEQGYDVNKISDALKNGDLQKDDVETFLGENVYDEIQQYNDSVEHNKELFQRYLINSVESNDIIAGNVGNLAVSDIVRLLKQGVPHELIILAGNELGSVQIAIAQIKAENDEINEAYNRLAPYGSQPEDSWKGVPYAFDMGDSELSLARNTFTIQQLAKYLRDNPDDTETLKLAGIDPDTIKQAKDYADEISQGINTIQGYLNIDDDKFGSEGYAISNAISQANIKLPPIPYPYNPKTGLYEDKENQRVLSQKDLLKIHWDSLTDEQKEQVTQLFAKDPNKGSYFASVNRMYQNIAEKGGIPAQVVLSPILPITNVIAKKITLDEAKEILKNTYSTELDALKDYIKDNGTVDIGKLEGQFDFNPELKKQILEKTGYDDFDELKRNIEYYNDNIRLTPEELATAVGVGLADILSFGGAGVLAGLGRAGVWAARTGWTAGGALFVPSAIKTITNPEAGIGEKVLAGAAPVLMIIGAAGVKGLPKGAKAIEQPTTISGKTTALDVVPAKTVINNTLVELQNASKIANTVDSIKLFTSETINALKGLPENTIKITRIAFNDVENALRTLTDTIRRTPEITSQLVKDAIRNAELTLVRARQFLQDLPENVRQQGNKLINDANEFIENTKRYAENTYSQILSDIDLTTAKLQQSVKDIAGNISEATRTGIENTIQELRIAINKASKSLETLPDELKYKLSKTVENARYYVEQLQSTISNKVSQTLSDIDVLTAQIQDAIKNLPANVKDSIDKTILNTRATINNAIQDIQDIPYNIKSEFGKGAYNTRLFAERVNSMIRDRVNQALSDIDVNIAQVQELLRNAPENARNLVTQTFNDAIKKIIIASDKAKYFVDSTRMKALNGINQVIADIDVTIAQIQDILVKSPEAITGATKTAVTKSINNIGTLIYQAKRMITDLPTEIRDIYRNQLDSLSNLQNSIKEYVRTGTNISKDAIKVGLNELQYRFDDILNTFKESPELAKTKINELIKAINNKASQYKDAITDTYDRFKYDVNLAEVERKMRGMVTRIENKLKNGEITDAEAINELDLLKQSTEWNNLSINRAINIRGSFASQTLKNILDKANIKGIINYDDIADIILESKSSYAGIPPKSLQRVLSILDEIDNLERDGKYNQTVKELIKQASLELDSAGESTPLFEDISKPSSNIDDMINNLDNELDNAKSLRDKVTKDTTRKKLDDYIRKTKIDIEELKKVKTQTKTKVDIDTTKVVMPEEQGKLVPDIVKESLPEKTIKESPVKTTKTTTRTITPLKTDIDITIMPLIESETELGIISYPFDPELYPDAARDYERLLREQINVRGYTEEQVKSELEQRIEELSRTMTREQAIKQALDEMDSRSSVSMFDEPFLSTSTQTQPETKTEPFAGESASVFPELETLTETETQPISEPMPRTEPLPEVEPIPETKTQPELETKIKESTKLGTVVLGKLKGEESQIYEADRVKPGTIEWRQGVKWAVSPPPYDSIIYLDNPLPGTTKFAVGKGSAAKTLQVIGGAPKEDVDLDMGWAKIKIEAKNGKLNMDFSGGAEAANERWSMERESMGVSEKQSYDSLPSQPITTKIPKIKVPTVENVQEIQTYESEPISELVLPKIRRSTKLNSEQSQIYLPQRTYLGRRLRPTSLGSI